MACSRLGCRGPASSLLNAALLFRQVETAEKAAPSRRTPKSQGRSLGRTYCLDAQPLGPRGKQAALVKAKEMDEFRNAPKPRCVPTAAGEKTGFVKFPPEPSLVALLRSRGRPRLRRVRVWIRRPLPLRKRIGNAVFFTQPFAQVNELAALGTERSVFALQPVPHLLAGGTADGTIGFHAVGWTRLEQAQRSAPAFTGQLEASSTKFFSSFNPTFWLFSG